MAYAANAIAAAKLKTDQSGVKRRGATIVETNSGTTNSEEKIN
jgi:hypothetical protein